MMDTIPRIKKLNVLKNYMLDVLFTDGKHVIYDVKKDIDTIPSYKVLLDKNLFEKVQLSESKSSIFWTDMVDLPSDILYEYGKEQKDDDVL